jgi:hypothetical protein
MYRDFQTWRDKVEEILLNTVQIPICGLADVPYYSYYEVGMSPLSAAQAAVDNEFGAKAPVLQYQEYY